jgi:hypothetical protein
MNGYDNYEDAAEATVTRAQAKREILKHDCSWEEFIAEVGDKAFYRGSEVLDWLGY